ncbi:MAG: class I SAM-dependent methyltransferase [Acidobacteria bacterium]|nr:class I SAM-dependent methyltransferase [Acidobacteriota bacterium]
MPEEHPARELARRLSREAWATGSPSGWWEPFYRAAEGDKTNVPWAEKGVNPNLIEWLDREGVRGRGQQALVVGCGLGDDAEELARRGFKVTAFDISPRAIGWCGELWPNSPVRYLVADLFVNPPAGPFDFVLEAYTLQALPVPVRPQAVAAIASLVRDRLLVIARGCDGPEQQTGDIPWPLTPVELAGFENAGLRAHRFEDFLDHRDPPVRRFRAEFRRVVD